MRIKAYKCDQLRDQDSTLALMGIAATALVRSRPTECIHRHALHLHRCAVRICIHRNNDLIAHLPAGEGLPHCLQPLCCLVTPLRQVAAAGLTCVEPIVLVVLYSDPLLPR